MKKMKFKKEGDIILQYLEQSMSKISPIQIHNLISTLEKVKVNKMTKGKKS